MVALLLMAFSVSGLAQFELKGTVKDNKRQPIDGASIALKSTYYGTSSAADGTFSFSIPDTGKKVLLITMMGFKPFEKEISIVQPVTEMDIVLKEAISEIKAVVITAGSFEAGDKKRATVLKSVDIVTTAGNQADLVSALKTLPGAQQIGEQEGLFVRGGTGAETKVFIDGMMVNNPFFSSVPDIAQRGRFSPLLFKGTNFSSGGYSAQYGQALSAALILETHDLPSRSEINAIISSPQLSLMGQHLNKEKNASVGMNVTYSNLKPYFDVVPQKIAYSKAPEILNTELFLRRKVKGGMYKFYAYANTNEVGFQKQNLDVPVINDHFRLTNINFFSTAVYSGKISDNWNLSAGASLSANTDNIEIVSGTRDSIWKSFAPQISNRLVQSKVTFARYFSGLTKLYMGAEVQRVEDKIFAPDSIPHIHLRDNYVAVYSEADIYYTSRLVQRVGVRLENSSMLNKWVVAPRISLAYKVTGISQFSFAYGEFYQKPEINYLFRKQDLDFTKATHYILNFQRIANGQTFRTEVFYKKYKSLLTFPSNNPFGIENNGSGYAKGLEIFWRDKQSVKGLDYWISYSWLDTKRKYLDYPSSVQPTFAARHTASLVMKSFVPALSSTFSATYTYASGRPFHDPNKGSAAYMNDRTIDYHSLGLQVNYLTMIRKMNAVFIINVNNVLGNEQVFGYHFSSRQTDGRYAKTAITPMANRFVFIGMYLSLGADKRTNILD